MCGMLRVLVSAASRLLKSLPNVLALLRPHLHCHCSKLPLHCHIRILPTTSLCPPLLQALLRDPVRLQSLLLKHPDLLIAIKSRLGL